MQNRRLLVLIGALALVAVIAGLGVLRSRAGQAAGPDVSAVPAVTLSPPPASAYPSPSVKPTKSPSASATPTATPTKSRALPTCFPYPAKKPYFTVDVKLKPGVTLEPKYLNAVKEIFQKEWPPAYATFHAPSDKDGGARHVVIQNEKTGASAVDTYTMNAQTVRDQVDRKTMDIGMNMHEASHMIVNPFKFKYDGAPKLYSEGITDFIRFVARGEGGIDGDWKISGETGAEYFDEKGVWNDGYRPGARFLAWLTQHYDTSGGDYKLVRDLNARLVGGDRDFQGVFTKTFGKSYHELFQAYRADRRVNPHC